MTKQEIDELINSRDCYLKETFFTRRTVYEITNASNVRICNVTTIQAKNISNKYLTVLFKEDYSGFTKRWYKIKPNTNNNI